MAWADKLHVQSRVHAEHADCSTTVREASKQWQRWSKDKRCWEGLCLSQNDLQLTYLTEPQGSPVGWEQIQAREESTMQLEGGLLIAHRMHR